PIRRNPRLSVSFTAATVVIVLLLLLAWKFAQRSQIAGLKDQVRARLDQLDGSRQQLTDIDRLVADLERYSAADGHQTAELVTRRLGEYSRSQVALLREPGYATEENVQR